MKKFVSIVICFCLLSGLCATFAACDKEYTYTYEGKTTYLLGESFDTNAVLVRSSNGKSKDIEITSDMVQDFSTAKATGRSYFTVTYKEVVLRVAYYVSKEATLMSSTPEELENGVYLYEDEMYGSNKYDNKFDVYLPAPLAELDADTPVFLYVHGGAWLSGLGDKSEGKILLQELAKAGFVAFSMDYCLQNMLGTGASFDDMLDDIGEMIAYMKNLLPKMGLNATSIAIGGVSAGGHLSTLYAYTCENSPLEIAFELDIVGPTQLSDESYQIAIETLLKEDSTGDTENASDITDEESFDISGFIQVFLPKIASGLLGLDYTLDLTKDDLSAEWALFDEYASVLYINPSSCLTILAYGVLDEDEASMIAFFPSGIPNDLLVPVTCYTKMQNTLTANEVPFEDMLFEGLNHGEVATNPDSLEWIIARTLEYADLYMS